MRLEVELQMRACWQPFVRILLGSSALKGVSFVLCRRAFLKKYVSLNLENKMLQPSWKLLSRESTVNCGDRRRVDEQNLTCWRQLTTTAAWLSKKKNRK